MINVIIVDDELPALRLAESVMKLFEEVIICGTFSDQDELMEYIPTTCADLILLDIKMPGIHGLELAGRINEMRPDLSIVFVTAYDNYAIDAFATETLDYILKPITEERMKITLERFKRRRKELSDNKAVNHIKVYSFGRFLVESETGEIMRFRTTKTEELFAFLIHQQGHYVSKDKIIQELWYDRDAVKAQSILYTTMYQLRKDMESFGLVNLIDNSRKEGGVCRLVWTPDYWDCTDYAAICQQKKNGNIDFEKRKQAVEIYKDGYLAEHGYGWAAAKSSQLEIDYYILMEEIITHEINLHRYEPALHYLKKWADLYPFDIGIHAKIIATYLLMNNRESALEYYKNRREIYIKEEGVPFEIDMNGLISDPFSAFTNNL